MSVKYQVLSTETAMIGVVKQKKKATGEMVEYHIQMGKAQQQAVEEEVVYQSNFNALFSASNYQPAYNPPIYQPPSPTYQNYQLPPQQKK